MKKILSAVLVCLLLLPCAALSASAADGLPFELVAPGSVTAVWREGGDSPTTTKLTYSLSNDMTTFFKNKENAVSLGRAIFNVLGQKYRLQARCTTSVEETKNLAEQLIQKAVNSNIETAVDNNTNQ